MSVYSEILISLIHSGDVAYREVIPLRAAVESLDTYQNTSNRGVYPRRDLFIKIVGAALNDAAIMICQFEDPNAASDDEVAPIASASTLSLPQLLIRAREVGDPQVLTRFSCSEIVNMFKENSFTVRVQCVMQGPRGVREISLFFFNPDHRRLFEFALQQSVPAQTPGGQRTRSSTLPGVFARADFVRNIVSIPFAGPGVDIYDEAWGEIDWESDDRLFRVVHPFYNEQMIWISKVSVALQTWLDSPPIQAHFLCGSGLRDHSGRIRSSIHRSPIDAWLESYMYGWGSWLRNEQQAK